MTALVQSTIYSDNIAAVGTVADLTAGYFQPNVTTIVCAGYYAPGDGGGAQRVLSGSSGPGPGLLQSADGQWWTLPQGAVNVRQFGAKGDNSTDDTTAIQACLNFCFGTTASPHGNSYWLNSSCYFPPGRYKTTAPLTLRSVNGGHIYGAGRFTTSITNTTAGSSVFVTNGFEYSKVDSMLLVATASTGNPAVIFDADWDNTGGVALQSNTFADVYFNIAATVTGNVGIRVGNTGYMGSEFLYLNCFWAIPGGDGVLLRNFNALQHTAIGGNCQGCNVGFHVFRGAFEVISGVGFQLSTTWDIQIDNVANDAYIISGCRTESDNFIFANNGPTMSIVGCSQVSANAGYFFSGAAQLTIDGSRSVAGYIKNARSWFVHRRGCSFRSDVYNNGGGNQNFGLVVDLDTQPTNPVNGSSTALGDSITTVGNGTIDGNGIVQGLVLRGGAQVGAFTDTTDTATNIISNAGNEGHPNSIARGQKISFLYVNTTSQAATVQAGSGVTMVPSTFVVAAGTSHEFRGYITSPTTPTITFYG